MASATRMMKAKEKMRNRKIGRKRKNKEAKRSTLTSAELFAEVDKAKNE